MCDYENNDVDYLSTGEPITLNFQALGLTLENATPEKKSETSHEVNVVSPKEVEQEQKNSQRSRSKVGSSLDGGSPRRNNLQEEGEAGGGEKA